MSVENQQRLTELLEQVTYRYAPERGVTASYIAMCLDVKGVIAPDNREDEQ